MLADVPLKDLVTPAGRMRQPDEAKVKALAESMEQIGQIVPIIVTVEELGPPMVYSIVAGVHRVEAARLLGWEKITTIEAGADEITCQIMEIDENLMRNDLSKAERAQHLKRRKELWEQKKQAEEGQVADMSASSLSDGRKKGPQHEQGFAAETATSTGLSKASINQEIAKAEKIDDAVLAEAAEQKLSGRALDRIAKADDQKAALQEEIGFKSARPKPTISREDRARAALLRALADAIEVLDLDEVKTICKEATE